MKKRLIANDLLIVYIDNFEIARVSITKFPGIFIDGYMTWKYHIEHVCNKCNKVSKSIGIMYKSRNTLWKRLIKQMYFSFIHSYLNYANIAWASTNKSNKFLFIAIKNMQLGLLMTSTALHSRNLSLNM